MKKNIILLWIILFVSSCTSNRKVSPFKVYVSSYLNVHSPNTIGWKLSKYKWGMIFSKKGREDSSYIASVIEYPLPKEISEETFLKIVKDKIKNINKERFELIYSSFKLSTIQGFKCIESQQLTKDNEAHISSTDTRILLFKISSFNCKLPKQDKGFMVSYSYRGKNIPKTFNEESKYFLNSISVKH